MHTEHVTNWWGWRNWRSWVLTGIAAVLVIGVAAYMTDSFGGVTLPVSDDVTVPAPVGE